MDKMICGQCGTENLPTYRFCKHCGALLPTVDKKPSEQKGFIPPAPLHAAADDINIEGVSRAELRAYLGRGGEGILEKFLRMHIENKRTAFCLPVLILGLIFGFLGLSFWFFWRKMNKIGFIFLGLYLLLFAGDLIINWETVTEYMRDAVSLSSSYAAYSSAQSLMEEIMTLEGEFIASRNTFFMNISSYVGGLIIPIVMSFYALPLYMKKALRDIKSCSAAFSGDGSYMLRLSFIGGTSGGRVFIPIGISFGVTFIFSALLLSALVM